MAERNKRLSENVAGKYYTDGECINCDLCVEIAPNFFKKGEDSQNQFVYKQPSLPSEILRMKEAIDSCPTEAIGDDGYL
jgi:ferredoxin